MNNEPDPDTAIALRQIHAFPAGRSSVFEDPADEKSSHGSQRYSALMGFYEGRDASWYESVTREFAGAGRVLDLGAGPGLCMGALSGHGVSQPIGVDRWRGFARDAEAAGMTIVLHDLTLPMPFFRSGAFDGIFSHYTLDYMSPIGVLQVLREARRLLAPGGRMVLYLAGAGLALGDVARTTPYGEVAVARLLTEAGWADFQIETPSEGRNTLVRARQADDPAQAEVRGEDSPLRYELPPGGELQVSAGVRLDGPEATRAQGAVAIELTDGERSLAQMPSLSSPAHRTPGGGGYAFVDLSVCVRLVAVTADELELQAWTWSGPDLIAADGVRLTMRPDLVGLRLAGGAGAFVHHTPWWPDPPMLEEPGDAYSTLQRAAPSPGPDTAWRPRPRQVVVERQGDDPDRLRGLTESKDQFLVRRPVPGAPPDLAELERDWAAGRLHGIVLGLDAARDPSSLALRLWADQRQALLYLEPESWDAIGRATELLASLRAPALLVDPSLSGKGEPGLESLLDGAADGALDRLPGVHLVLGVETAGAAPGFCERHPARILLGGLEDVSGRPGGEDSDDEGLYAEAAETLRYLTERTTLMWCRGTSGRTPAELGRRPGFAAV